MSGEVGVGGWGALPCMLSTAAESSPGWDRRGWTGREMNGYSIIVPSVQVAWQQHTPHTWLDLKLSCSSQPRQQELPARTSLRDGARRAQLPPRRQRTQPDAGVAQRQGEGPAQGVGQPEVAVPHACMSTPCKWAQGVEGLGEAGNWPQTAQQQALSWARDEHRQMTQGAPAPLPNRHAHSC